jgi:hypothetical protein
VVSIIRAHLVSQSCWPTFTLTAETHHNTPHPIITLG